MKLIKYLLVGAGITVGAGLLFDAGMAIGVGLYKVMGTRHPHLTASIQSVKPVQIDPIQVAPIIGMDPYEVYVLGNGLNDPAPAPDKRPIPLRRHPLP